MTTTVFHGGSIIREFSPAREVPAPTAIAIREGRIIAEDAAALALLPTPDCTVIDLEGGALTPAFGDGHAHPQFGGLEDVGPRIRPCRSVDEIVAEVKRWAAEHPDDPWIIGASYDATLAPAGVFDRRWLDAAVPDRPVVLRAWDYHTVWANSAALERAGITRDTPDPPLGRVVRDGSGDPVGTLRETGAVELVMQHAPSYPVEVRVDALRRASRAFLDQGTTWVQEAWVDEGDVDGWIAAAEQGALEIRFNLAFRADPLQWRAQEALFRATRERIAALSTPMLSARTVKFFVDGVIENGTAALLDGYRHDVATEGLANWTDGALADAAIAFDAAGFQLHFHAIGDAAARSALDAIAAAEERNGARDRRPVIAHVQLIDDADIARLARHGVIANFEPLWSQRDPGMLALTIPMLPEQHHDRQYRIRSVADAGAVISFGSDWPVTHLDWRTGSAVAVSRRTPDGEPAGGWMPAERVDSATALRAYTAGVAHQAFADDGGRIAVGNRADLVWLDRDPLTVPSEELHRLTVRGTWVAGRHHRPA